MIRLDWTISPPGATSATSCSRVDRHWAWRAHKMYPVTRYSSVNSFIPLLFYFVGQDLVHFCPGFTHTPPVGLSTTYTSPSVSQRLWGQECGVDLSGSRGEHWGKAVSLVTLFWMRTTEAGEEPESVLWRAPAAPTRWKTTLASTEDLEPCSPILKLHFVTL